MPFNLGFAAKNPTPQLFILASANQPLLPRSTRAFVILNIIIVLYTYLLTERQQNMDDLEAESPPLFEFDTVTKNRSWNRTQEQLDDEPSAPQYNDYILNGIVVPTLFNLISLIGVVGNVLVIYVIVTKARMRTNTNMLLLNVAVGDLVFVVIVPPLTAYQFATSNWPFGDFACRLMHYVVDVEYRQET